MNFETVASFENKVAEFFNAPFAIAVDSCTHGVELCLRLTQSQEISVPKRTYLSIPFLAEKLKIKRTWREENLKDYYFLTPEEFKNIVIFFSNI